MAELWFDTPLGQALLEKIKQQPMEHRQPLRIQRRMYSAAKASRLTVGFNPPTDSADSELVSSLTSMRARSRALVRDASYAKRAKIVVVNNVIGSGIGTQAQVRTSRGDLNERVNSEIEDVWEEWCKADSCHTGGRLHFAHLERALMAQVFEAGEAFVRLRFVKFGNSRIPLALELVEAERIADQIATPYLNALAGNEIRMGIEVDAFGRPQAYWIRRRHPSELRFSSNAPDEIERVPADQIIHLAVVDRWPQTRGEPWMHTAIRRLNDMDGYSEAEIIRARGQAVRMGIIETPEDAESFAQQQDDGSYEMEMEPGVITRLNPGEQWKEAQVNSPNPQLDPFMRYMLREMAAGTGVSYESLSRDYSQSNYSSSRLALLDDRDLWKFYQCWFIRDFRSQIHALFIRQAVLAGAITSIRVDEYANDMRKFEAVRFKPRGWSWIDPTKEVQAYKEAVIDGFTTVSDVIAQTGSGRDIEDVLNEREQELKLMESKGLVFETSPEFYDKEDPPPKLPATTEDSQTEDPPPRRVFSFRRK